MVHNQILCPVINLSPVSSRPHRPLRARSTSACARTRARLFASSPMHTGLLQDSPNIPCTMHAAGGRWPARTAVCDISAKYPAGGWPAPYAAAACSPTPLPCSGLRVAISEAWMPDSSREMTSRITLARPTKLRIVTHRWRRADRADGCARMLPSRKARPNRVLPLIRCRRCVLTWIST